MSRTFTTESDIHTYLLSQDEELAEKLISAYNWSVSYIQPVTIEQCELIMWDVLDFFNLI